VEVTVTGTPDATTGMAADLGHLDAVVARRILDGVDHYTLEDAPMLAGVISTGEGLARAFWNVLAPALPAGQLVGIVVRETAKNRFEYRGE
jgi:6-pyruvoyl-tetrahydropterin synthase